MIVKINSTYKKLYIYTSRPTVSDIVGDIELGRVFFYVPGKKRESFKYKNGTDICTKMVYAV